MNAYYMWFTMVDAIRSGSVALSRELSAIHRSSITLRFTSHTTEIYIFIILKLVRYKEARCESERYKKKSK